MTTAKSPAPNNQALAELAAVHVCAGGDFGVAPAAGGGLRLVTLRAFAVGHRLFSMTGQLGALPSRYSLQLGPGLHLHLGPELSEAEILHHHFWRFMNHSCQPSALIHGREVLAGRDLQAGEAVSFDYNSTEWDMAEAFDCRCGSANCLGRIQGFKHLSDAQRAGVRGVAPHVLAAAA